MIEEIKAVIEKHKEQIPVKVIAEILAELDEAEAKLEAECCEWKIDNQSNFYIVYKTSCGNQRITGIVGEKYCCHCGKPIKISEVE